MRFDVITLFPDLIKDSFNYGVTGRALTSQKILLNTLNPRDFSNENNGKVDDRPYGGGPGMVMQPEPMIKAIRLAKSESKNPYTIFMSPQGSIYDQNKAKELSKKEHLTIDTIGSEISSLNGKWAAFKINDGSSDEYFLAYVDTTNNQLKNIFKRYNHPYKKVNWIK